MISNAPSSFKTKLAKQFQTFFDKTDQISFRYIHYLPVYPDVHVQTYSCNDFKMQVALLRQGEESQAFGIGISQRLAVNPTGQEQAKEGVPPLLLSRTIQDPPFWHRGPVWQGFKYWQYSPTYFAVQLKQTQNNFN